MCYFEKKDMKYSYNWNVDSENFYAISIRFLNSDLLDLNDGIQVLNYINSYMKLKNYSMRCSFHKIEKALIVDLPETKRGYGSVKRWLNENCIF